MSSPPSGNSGSGDVISSFSYSASAREPSQPYFSAYAHARAKVHTRKNTAGYIAGSRDYNHPARKY